MTYRMDKFKVGDTIVWSEEYGDNDFARPEHGDGPFTITKIKEYTDHLESRCHTQGIWFEGSKDVWSGAYFRKV